MAEPLSPSSLPPSTSPHRIRWWPGLLVLGLFAGGLGALEFIAQDSVQQKWMKQAMLGIGAGTLLLLWFFFAGKFSRSLRKRAFLILAAACVLCFALFKYEGVSGDLMPKFTWRWSQHTPLAMPTAAADGALPGAPAGAADFPQFLGPQRDATLKGPKLARDWKQSPPQLLWRQPIGEGWGGFVTSGGVAITQEQRGDQELVVAYNLLTGKVLWSDAEPTRYENPLGGIGPRATPTIADGKVYTMGAKGHFHVLDLATGKRLWTKNIVASNAASVPEWGISASPLLHGESVIVVAGQSKGATLAAYAKSDGTRLWVGGNQSASYSSPVMAKLEGREQVIYFGPDKLTGLDPANGKLLWEVPWCATNKYPNVAIPVALGADSFLISAGYGKGSAEIKITHPEPTVWQAEEVWKTLKMKAKFTNLVQHQGFIYGLDDGIMACQDPRDDGRLKWRDGRYGHGQCLLVGNLLLLMAEDGSVVLIDPNPEALRELATIPVFTDKTWNPPALAGEYLLIRNDREAACFRLAIEP